MAQEVSVRSVGMARAEGAPVVVLDADDRVVPVLVTPDQAHAIELALAGEHFERPLTHDVLAEVVTEFGGAVDRVRIDDIHDGTFLAKLDAEQYVAGDRHESTFDVRASDAIAIALRVDCPIELSESVLQTAGQPSEEFTVEGFEE